MSERTDIAQGFPKTSKENVKSFWEQVAVQLNSPRPPVNDTTTWNEDWLNYNKTETRTIEGGSNSIHAFTSGVQGMQTFGSRRRTTSESRARSPPLTANLHDCSMQSVLNTDTPDSDTSIRALLQKQINKQKKVC